MNVIIQHTSLTESEVANNDNNKSNISLNLENDEYGSEVVRLLREQNITLCHELAVHRELLLKIVTHLGIEDAEFEELNRKVNEAKEKAKKTIAEKEGNE